jgi:NADPH2:quinone reductase
MKAIRVKRYGDPEVMQLEEAPDLKPGPGEVLIQIEAAGVNPVDTYLRAGAQGYQPSLPYTPGLDGAGTVLAVAPAQNHHVVGSRVYVAGSLTGTYADRCLCKDHQVYALPESLTFAQGAAIGVPYATAYRALFQCAHAEPGDWVLVHGASGGVGIAAVQLAVAAGMRIVGTAGTPEGRDLVLQQGALAVFDHLANDYEKSLAEVTDGYGYDVILEMLANVNLSRDLSLLAQRARVVVIGNRGTIEINPRELMRRDAIVIGMSLVNANDADKRRIHAVLRAGFSNSSLRPVIQRELPLAEAARAHREVMDARSLGKIVLVP